MKRYYLYFLILFLASQDIISKSPYTGRPFVTNFTPKEYPGGTQNWCAVQDNKGVLYFGNQSGVLKYDGIKWNLIKVLDGRTVFILTIDNDNEIWCGTQNDFGYLASDSIGSLKYISCEELIPDTIKPIGKVRSINIIDDEMYFLSTKYLLRKSGDSVNVWSSETSFYRQHIINNKLYVYESRFGLKTVQDDSLIISHNFKIEPNDPPTSIFEYTSDSIFISTWKNGLFKYSGNKFSKFVTDIDDQLIKNPVIDAHYISPSKFILAGFNGGSYLIDTDGNFLLKYDKSTGLNNELCNRILIDKTNAIWLSNNYGISRIETFSPFSFYGEEEGLIGNLVDIARIGDKIYTATDNKLYFLNERNNRFEVVPNTELCWDLLPVGNELLAAANYGVYVIKNDRSELVVLDQKKCFSLHRSEIDSNKIFVGTNTGMEIIRKINGRWTPAGKINGIDEEIRQVTEISNGELWICTYGDGIINCSIKDDEYKIRKYKLKDGLQDLKFYKITVINDEPFFFSPASAVLRFDSSMDKFYPDSVIFNGLGHISRMVVDPQNNIWIQTVTSNGGLISVGNQNKSGIYSFDSQIFKRIESFNTKTIYPEPDGIVWIGHQFGLIKYDANYKYDIPDPFPAIVSSVRFNDSTVFAGTRIDGKNFKFPYDNNNIRIEYALPSYDAKESIRFQYYLDDYESDWSNWTIEAQKDYTNLFEGDYKFFVRGKDVYGNISREDVFEFTILPPWYRTMYAYISYLVLFGASIIAVDRIRTRQINNQNKLEIERKLKYQSEIEKAKSEERKTVRKETAADFHDELGHLLTKISLFTEMARKNSKDNLSIQKYLSGIVNNTYQLSSGMKDLIWTLDSDRDTVYDVLIRIKDFGESLFEHSSITFLTSGFPNTLEDVKISMKKRRHLVLIFKEIMNNCLKYSNCKTAELNSSVNSNELSICFTDDGVGFDPKNADRGNGLRNINMRAKDIGAQVFISSKNGQTSVNMIMKL
jgi:signal transduction histidine kinase